MVAPMLHPPYAVVLVSASPRRKELLESAGWQVHTFVVPTQEDATGPTPEHTAMAIAEQKLAAAGPEAQARLPESLRALPQVAADTLVVLGHTALGKPRDGAHALSMLQALSGVAHRVVTGVVVQHASGAKHSFAVSTEVRFRPLSAQELQAYVQTGEPFDKAGGYGIQGLGGHLVQEVRGSLTNVIGLPLMETLQALAAAS